MTVVIKKKQIFSGGFSKMMNNEYSIQSFAQSALTAIFLAFIKTLLGEVQFWTGRFSDFMAFIWNDLLLAIYLSIDVIQYAVVESIGLMVRGDHLRTIMDIFKSAIYVILYIFQGAFQALKSFIKYGDPFLDNRHDPGLDEVDNTSSESDPPPESQTPDKEEDLDMSLSLD